MPELINHQLQLAWEYVTSTGENLFLTGKAGTGKTTFLRRLKSETPKRMVVAAPTGVAAINAGGVTLHSLFQLPFGPQVPVPADANESTLQSTDNNRYSKEKINIIRSIDLLVIDEISMVRADLLDAVDRVMRRFKNRYKPFGGTQLLMIGDLQQLSPVVKPDEWELLKPHYETPYFFSSQALRKTSFVSIELQHIYRQSDKIFIDLLNKVRNNQLDQSATELLNSRYKPELITKKPEGYITLTTHNNQAQQINLKKLEQLETKTEQFEAEVEGSFPEYAYPTDFNLQLKTGAQVMFVKNDISREKLYFNGKIGRVIEIDDDGVHVQCDDDDYEIVVKPVEWNNYAYSLNPVTNEIVEEVIGIFRQLPLKLAWAITIHKSQGLTFDRAIIDANAAFAHGQVYVALSRCRSLEGLLLSSPIHSQSVKTDNQVTGFTRNIEQNQPDQAKLSQAQAQYQLSLLLDLNDFQLIQRRLAYLIKLLDEHKAILVGDLWQEFANLQTQAKEDLFMVSERFEPQIKALFAARNTIQANEPLLERVAKASIYYLDKTEKIIDEKCETFNLGTDNTAVRKSLTEAFERFVEALIQKVACLKIGAIGFSVDKYLLARATALLENSSAIRKNKPSTAQPRKDLAHPILFEKLRQWRNELAAEQNIDAYMILSQKAISAIADTLPANSRELGAIKGIGKVKLRNFGTPILELVHQYCAKHLPHKQIDVNVAATNPPEKSRKEKPDTRMATLEQFRAGKSIAETARIRGLSPSTIETHAIWLIANDEVSVTQLVDSHKIRLVKSYLDENTNHTKSTIMETLGDNVTWSELRMIMASIKLD